MKKLEILLGCSALFFLLFVIYSSRNILSFRTDSPKEDIFWPQATTITPLKKTKDDYQAQIADQKGYATGAKTKCKSRKNIFFMKTHKTGSTTMQNILLRYAWTHDLTVGLPLKSNNFDYANRKKFDRTMVQSVASGREINMLIHHMIFSRPGVAAVLPHDAFYFTVLRDPATQFESVYKYFKTVVAPFTKAKSFEDFIANPPKYFESTAKLTFSWFAKNGMAFDLGFDNLNEGDAKIKSIIKEMDDTFDIVLISEYFDMSLILLKEGLCWTMTDIAYLSVNARRTSTVPFVDGKLSNKIRSWNKIDSQLYKYYNATFWKRVKKFGIKRMQAELKQLNKIKSELKLFCVEDGLFINKDITDGKYKMYNPPGVEMTQYHLKKEAEKNETCIQLILPEIPWWQKMTQHQRTA